jgi:hypothetical protein
MKHHAASPWTSGRPGLGSRSFAGLAMAFALSAGMPAHARVSGVTEARFEPSADLPSKAIKQRLVACELDAAPAAAVRDTLSGLSQSDAGKRTLAASSYSGFVSPSTDVEKTLTAWLG